MAITIAVSSPVNYAGFTVSTHPKIKFAITTDCPVVNAQIQISTDPTFATNIILDRDWGTHDTSFRLYDAGLSLWYLYPYDVEPNNLPAGVYYVRGKATNRDVNAVLTTSEWSDACRFERKDPNWTAVGSLNWRVAHIRELREAVAGTLAFRGLPAVAFTDDLADLEGTRPRAVHITELRTPVGLAHEFALGASPPTWPDEIIADVTAIQDKHLTQLQTRLEYC